MELQEVVEVIVKQSKDKRVESDFKNIVGSILSDVEYWPAWYLGLLDGEENFDFSAKKPSPTQKADIAALQSAMVPFVKKSGEDGVVAEKAALAIAERIVYWEDWYWDEAEQWNASSFGQDDDQDLSIYGRDYGLGIE